MRLNKSLLLAVLTTALLSAAWAPFIEPKSSNPCSSCHNDGRYMYLDVLEGDSGEVMPSSINVSQALNVTVVVSATGDTTKNNVMSSIKVTLASKNGCFSVTNSSYNLSSITVNGTGKAYFEIKGVSAGNDTIYINATAKNTHKSSISFSDTYSPSPSINVSNASNQAPSISLTGPSSGADLTGGSLFKLNWTATDNDLAGCRIALFYSTDSFSSSNGSIASNLSAASSVYNWTLPRINSTTVTLKALINDSGGLSANSSTKSDFTIDTAPPSVSAAWPANASTGVPTTDSLVVNFSEPMNRTGAEAAFSISPDPGGLGWSWNLNATSMSGTHTEFKAGTQYNCSISGFNDSSLPGNQNSSKHPWTFTTAPNDPPTIGITAPAAGAVLSGGSAARIAWTATDEALAGCTVSLYYSTDGFALSNSSIASNLGASSQSYNWTLPKLDSATVRVKGVIRDGQGQSGDGSSANFTVDSTAPAVSKVSPAAGAVNVSSSSLMTITFSEPVNETGALSGYSISPDPGGIVWTWNGNYTSVSAIHNTLNDSTTYKCSISGFMDLSSPGNTNGTQYLWNFTTAAVSIPMPSIVLAEPSGGEIFYWGDRITAKWSAAGGTGNLTINVSYSQNGTFGPFKAVATSLSNNGSYSFDAPEVTSGNCLVRLVVRDAKGMEANDSSQAAFWIVRPPSISAQFGSKNVTYEGDKVAISWNGTGGYGSLSVLVLFSPGDGGAPATISSGLAAAGNLTWVAAGGSSDWAMLSINATDGNGRSVQNLSAPFSFSAALRIAATFSQGDVLYSGDNVRVGWNRTGGFRSVNLSLLLRTGSGPDRTLAANLSAAGTLDWTAIELEADGAVLVLSAADQNGAAAENVSSPFSLARALLISASFGHDKIVYAKDKVDVGWSHTGGYRNVTVSLWLRAGAGADQMIGSALSPEGALEWTAIEQDSEGAILVLVATDQGGRSVENASTPFPLARPPSLRAGFSGGPVLYSGEAVDGSWVRTGGYHNVTVSLWLRAGAASDRLVGSADTADGSLRWNVPEQEMDGALLVLVANDEGGRSAESASMPFSVACALRIAGSFPQQRIVYSGDTADIGWMRTGGYRNVTVSLWLRAGAGAGQKIGAANDAQGSLRWTAPEMDADGVILVLVATDQNGKAAENASAPVTLARSLLVRAEFPVGPVAYSGNSAMLSWNCTGGFGDVLVSLEFRAAPGGPAAKVATGLRKAGSLSWTTPGTASDGAVLSFTATDVNGRSAMNASRGFSIAMPLLLTADFPVDGVVAAGTVTTVTWKATGGSGGTSVSLYLVAWGQPRRAPVAVGLPREGRFGWMAPEINLSAVALVLVATDGDGMSAEASSAPFAVRPAGSPPVRPPGDPPFGGLDLNALPAVGLIVVETRVVEDTLVTFDASTSSDPEGGALRFDWDFGDGTTPVQNGPAVQVHRFGKPGSYPVRLSVSDGRDSVNRTVVMTVVPRPSGPAAEPQGIAIPAGFWVVLAFVILVVAGMYYAHLDSRRDRSGSGAGRDVGTPGQAHDRPDGPGDGPPADDPVPPRGPRTGE